MRISNQMSTSTTISRGRPTIEERFTMKLRPEFDAIFSQIPAFKLLRFIEQSSYRALGCRLLKYSCTLTSGGLKSQCP